MKFSLGTGAVIIFTGLLSVAFLGRVLKSREWIGIFSVILGLIVVGLTDTLFSTEVMGRRNDIITGLPCSSFSFLHPLSC